MEDLLTQDLCEMGNSQPNLDVKQPFMLVEQNFTGKIAADRAHISPSVSILGVLLQDLTALL